MATHLKEAEATGVPPTGIVISCHTCRLGGHGHLELIDYDGNYLMCFNEKLWAWFERIAE